ncbi:MAG: sigma-54-dependent Fis family transcriptional regulator, partial [Rhodocyclaceae bacterium]|nr:sigma-54-dependent Fis family transcriptional regulator [Rhodocyclaceae bacterium]
ARQLPFDLTEEAAAHWQDYHFPGNVRELRNIVIRLATKYPGRKVSAAELEGELDTQSGDATRAWLPPQDIGELSEIALRHLQQRGQFDLDDTLRRWEQGYIQAALRLTHGNVSQAAKLLGVNRTTLYNRMEVLERDLGAA